MHNVVTCTAVHSYHDLLSGAIFVVCTLCPEGENMLSRLAERDDLGARAELLLLSQLANGEARRAKGSGEEAWSGKGASEGRAGH